MQFNISNLYPIDGPAFLLTQVSLVCPCATWACPSQLWLALVQNLWLIMARLTLWH